MFAIAVAVPVFFALFCYALARTNDMDLKAYLIFTMAAGIVCSGLAMRSGWNGLWWVIFALVTATAGFLMRGKDFTIHSFNSWDNRPLIDQRPPLGDHLPVRRR